MKLLNNLLGLFTDMYQLSMIESYLKEGRHNTRASFDYFFRKLPFDGGYVIFTGLYELLENLSEIRFSSDDIDFLRRKKASDEFLDYLKDFSFRSSITSVDEGTIVFPNEPVVSVEGSLAEVQLIETYLLNTLNFNSLISTKASRIRLVAPNSILSDFGLRRAQGLGGIQASKAAIAGGFDSTSNVLAAKQFGLNAVGTMAHSFVQSFDDELTAFRKFVNTHPDNTVLVIDTYNTLQSGLPNAITVAKEMEKRGLKLRGVRLDSGDLAYLSKSVRRKLNDEGLNYVRIIVSNQLDERVIKSLLEQDAPIDIFGVGTNLVTGNPDAALDGVYKLSMFDSKPRLKVSENIFKVTLPGLKKIIRYCDDEGYYQADAITLRDEDDVDLIVHPFEKEKLRKLNYLKGTVLTKEVVNNGNVLIKTESPEFTRERVKENLARLPAEYKRFEFPHIYKVGISKKLLSLRDELKSEFTSYTRDNK